MEKHWLAMALTVTVFPAIELRKGLDRWAPKEKN